jgi:hypothetical protein
MLLGQALALLGRREQALDSSRSAVMSTDELVGPPARWQAQAALGQVAHTVGDDDTPVGAYNEAASLIETFAATLAPERAAHLLAAPAIAEIVSLAGRRTVA